MYFDVIDRRVSARIHPTPSKAQNLMDLSWGRGGSDNGRGVKTADKGSLIACEPAGLLKVDLTHRLRYDTAVGSVTSRNLLGVEGSRKHCDRTVIVARSIG